MDEDDRVDTFAILGLIGVGLALMLVGSLNPAGPAIVLAVFVPMLGASVAAVITAAIRWRYGGHAAGYRRDDQPLRRGTATSGTQCRA